VRARAKARRAWLEILRLLYSAIGQHRVVSIAAGVAFFVLLAIFPAIAALVSVYGIFADPAAIRTNLNEISSLLPDGQFRLLAMNLAASHRAEQALWAQHSFSPSACRCGAPMRE
jgi:uncharacterized BrkB/YihY/UPF0761 family membrane protein